MSHHGEVQAESPKGPVERSLLVLELVAERGGASAREIANWLALPLPTVYRIANALAEADYLVHIRAESRYELGHKLHALGQSLHRQIGMSRPVAREITRLHEDTGFAAYLTVLRGAELVIVYVVDSPDCPRLPTMHFGFHDVPHSTAFGKILLAEQDACGRDLYLSRHGMRSLTANTITERNELDAELGDVALRGIAWEREEFLAGFGCAAVPVRGPDAALIGAVAISAQPEKLAGREATVEAKLRNVAFRVAACLRGAQR